MVGISTAQNIVNVLPAVQLMVNSFLFVETDFATKQNWSNGSSDVLKKRKINVLEPLFLAEDDNTNLAKIVSQLIQRLEIYPNVNFNLGGGQKMHSIALWDCFAARSANFSNDSACYIDQTTKKIFTFRFENGRLKTTEVNIQSKLNAIEIFEIFGFEVTDDGESFYGNHSQNIEEVKDYTKYQDFRTFISQSFKTTENVKDQAFTLTEIKAMFGHDKVKALKDKIESSITSIKKDDNSVSINKRQYDDQFYNCILKTIKEQILIPTSIFGNEFELDEDELIQLFKIRNPICNTKTLGNALGSTFGIYFEKILIQRIQTILNSNNHIIITALSNLKIKRGNDNAEYDVVLVTNQGTLIVLDAKTDDFTKKDEDARNYNLLASAGAYAKFIPVYLFYSEDLSQGNLSQSIKVKIKDSSINRKPYLTFNTDENNKEIEIENIKIKLNPINEILEILKLK